MAKVGAGLVVKPIIFNPFSQASALDFRLRALSTSGQVVKELVSIFNQKTNLYGNVGFQLYAASHGLKAGSYKLELQYKAANSTTWFPLPSGTAANPWALTVRP